MNSPKSVSHERPVSRPSDTEIDQWIGATRFQASGLVGGCVITFGSAVVTCCLLVLNGALVMAILEAMAAAGVEWVNSEPASQFVLFAAPICLTIIQWMMIDTLRGILRRQRRRRSGYRSTDP